MTALGYCSFVDVLMIMISAITQGHLDILEGAQHISLCRCLKANKLNFNSFKIARPTMKTNLRRVSYEKTQTPIKISVVCKPLFFFVQCFYFVKFV